MKLETVHREIQSSGVITEGSFGISLKDGAHVFSILRDKLYSDKVLAVIREYCTNALDAHIEAGKPTLPIKVLLPNNLSPYFSVRDYGLGLSDDEVFNVYVQYGASTKRQSNDVMGQLGLGCKSAFAYTDSFTVTSWRDGKRTIFTAYIDETNVGKIVKLSSDLTDEPSGIEIKLAVRVPDIASFKQKAEYIFKYFKTKPDTNIQVATTKKSFEGHGWYFEDDNGQYGYYGNPKQAVATIGHIPYPLNNGELTKTPVDNGYGRRTMSSGMSEDDKISAVLAAGPVIEVPIGDASVSASREQLEYTDLTKKNLRKLILGIYDEMSTKIGTSVLNAKTAYEAMMTRQKLTGTLRGTLANFIPQKWKNLDLTRQDLHADFDGKLQYTSKAHNITGIRSPNKMSRNIHSPYQWKCIAVDDSKSSYIKRVGALVQSKGYEDVLILSTGLTDRKAAKDILDDFLKKHPLFDGIPVHYLADVNYTITRGTGNGATQKAKAYKYDPKGKQHSNSQLTASHYWEPTVIDLKQDGGVYVVIDYYEAKGFERHNLKFLHEKLPKLRKDFKDIYGIKVANSQNLDPQWIPLTKVIEDTTEEYFKKYKKQIERDLIGAALDNNLRTMSRELGKIFKELKLPREHMISLVGRLRKAHDTKSKSVLYEELLKSCSNSTKMVVSRTEYDNRASLVIEEITRQYPLLQYVPHLDDSGIQAVQQYITLVDQMESK